MKKYNKLFLIHSYYLFSKRNVVVFVASFLLIQLFCVVILFENRELSINEIDRIDIIWQSIFTFEKIIIGLLSIFLIGNFCLPESNDYSIIFIISEYKKTEFYIMKILTISFFLLAYTLLSLLFFFILFLLVDSYFMVEQKYIYSFILIYIVSTIYGFLTIIFINILPTFFTIFLSFILFLSSDLFVENKWLSTFFPSLIGKSNELESINLIIKLIIVLLFYFIILIIISRGKNS